MHPLVCLFEDPPAAFEESGFIARMPQGRWQSYGSALTNFTSDSYRSAYLSDSEEGLGMALILKESGDPDASLDFLGGFPVLVDGMPLEVELLSHIPNAEDGSFGWLTVLTSRRTQLMVSDPDFLEHEHLLKEGSHYRAEACAWICSASLMGQQIKVTEGPALEIEKERRQQEEPGFDPESLTELTYSMANMRSLMERDEPGWHEYITRIENLRETRFDGRRGWLFEGVVENPESEEPPLRLAFGMMEHSGLDGYVPAEGDLVAGVAFLQLLLKEELAHEGTPWADRPADSEFMWADIMAALQTGDGFAGSPMAVRLTAGILAQNGWEVSSPPGWEGELCDHPPMLMVERGDEQHLVSLEINGAPAHASDFVLPVKCVAQGKGHEASIEPSHPAAQALRLKTHQVWMADDL